MAITILISVTGHMVVADIYNFLVTLCNAYSLCFLQAPWLVIVPSEVNRTFILDISGLLAACLY